MDHVWQVNDNEGEPFLYEAILVERRAAWRVFRNPENGDEWKENGMYWFPTREEALRDYIKKMAPLRDSTEGKLIDALFGKDAERDEQRFRNMVKACVMLARLWEAPPQLAIAPSDEERNQQ